MKKAQIGMIGLAVMGENLSLNIESRGYRVSTYDIDSKRVDGFGETVGKDKNFILNYNIEDFVNSLEKPRKIMMMIRAGNPVDQVIEQLIPLLDKGDIVIDGGNSNFTDTNRRYEYLESKGIHFVGSGVSGGEEGALTGPSIMPGGSEVAWHHIKPIFQAIAADVDGDKCSEWIGSGGSGHFVKMVHNGIEYGDMQLITEVYDLMHRVLKLDHKEMSEIFNKWNQGRLDSYLIEITSNILDYKDTDGNPLVTKILDKAGQKGTGKWTAINSLDEGVALNLITEAVYARIISSKKDERIQAEKLYKKKTIEFKGDKAEFLSHLENALYASKIVSYAQGFDLMKTTSKTYDWKLNFVNIAKIWRGGCIIRSKFLNNIMEAYNKDENLVNLIFDDFFKNAIELAIDSWRIVVSEAVKFGIPTPAMSSALFYFDSYTTAMLPTSLIQAQRDYFGAHTYERIDRDEGEFFHTNWTGKGGDTSSTTYNE